MEENYNSFIPLIKESLKERPICGVRREDVRVVLSDVVPAQLFGLIREKAIYDVIVVEGAYRMGALQMFDERNMGELHVRKSRRKLSADLMTRYKTDGWSGNKLTLESSFKIPLN